MVIRNLFCGSAAQGIKPGVRTNMYLLSKSHVRLFWHFLAWFHLTSSYKWSHIIKKWTGEKNQLPCVQIYLLHFDYWVQITSTLNQQISCSMSLEKSLNLADFSEKPSPTNNFYFIFFRTQVFSIGLPLLLNLLRIFCRLCDSVLITASWQVVGRFSKVCIFLLQQLISQ